MGTSGCPPLFSFCGYSTPQGPSTSARVSSLSSLAAHKHQSDVQSRHRAHPQDLNIKRADAAMSNAHKHHANVRALPSMSTSTKHQCPCPREAERAHKHQQATSTRGTRHRQTHFNVLLASSYMTGSKQAAMPHHHHRTLSFISTPTQHSTSIHRRRTSR